MTIHVAIDLGAGSGRAFVGSVADGRLQLDEVHRFRHTPRPAAGHLRWDMSRLFEGLRAGLAAARSRAEAHGGRIASVGVDTWGVDYGLLDRDGRLIEEPVCYRDDRTTGMMDRVFARVPRADLVARTGIACLQFNTLYQLVAQVDAGLPPETASLLMMPDLCHHYLCGAATTEFTIASTTQLVAAGTGNWDAELFDRLGLPLAIMPEILPAGSPVGRVGGPLGEDLQLTGLPVVAPAAHDTGSAVVGTPLRPGWAFVSSGTWSLVGVERDGPVLTEEAARSNFTNEGGAFGTVRFLKNVMGLWLLEASRREWPDLSLGTLLDQVAAVEGFVGFVYPDAGRFFNPSSMVREIQAALVESGQEPVHDPALLTKVILDSLALRVAVVVESIERLTAASIEGVHVVGGGSQNDYLNQGVASATGRPVLAGPIEATATGNLLVQAIAAGELKSVADGRQLVEQSGATRRFEPRDQARWAEAMQRYREIEARAAGPDRLQT